MFHKRLKLLMTISWPGTSDAGILLEGGLNLFWNFARSVFQKLLFYLIVKLYRRNTLYQKLNNILDENLSRKIFREVGELGFLGVDIPEKFGGLELDKSTSSIIVDCLSSGESASVMVGDRGVDMSAATRFGVVGILCNSDTGISGVIDSILGDSY